jgi:hypothetical protein
LARVHSGESCRRSILRFRPVIVGSNSGFAPASSNRRCVCWRGCSTNKASPTWKKRSWMLPSRAPKRGFAVGPTRRGKRTKIVAVAADNSLPLAVSVQSASPAKCKLVEEVLAGSFLDDLPARLIGDKAYESDKLDQKLRDEYGMEMIAPNRHNRGKPRIGESSVAKAMATAKATATATATAKANTGVLRFAQG